MDINDLLRQRSGLSPKLWKAQILLGIGLIGFGTAVIVWPPILTFLVSGLCVLLGLMLLSFGLKLRRMSAQAFPGTGKTQVFTRK